VKLVSDSEAVQLSFLPLAAANSPRERLTSRSLLVSLEKLNEIMRLSLQRASMSTSASQTQQS
jgi:hypothetical protein